jgi:AcrR family transcriptional regulator
MPRPSASRQRIIEAAEARFVERGYGSTTIEGIARSAGVAVQTVYYGFGTKAAILAAVLDARIAGDHDPAPVIERDWVGLVEGAPDAAAAIEAVVGRAVEVVARAAPVYEVVARASTDPEIGRLLDRTRRARRTDQRRLVELLAGAGHLHPGLELDTAADAFYALVNEELHQLLVVDCGWDLGRFRAWTVEVVAAQLGVSRAR